MSGPPPGVTLSPVSSGPPAGVTLSPVEQPYVHTTSTGQGKQSGAGKIFESAAKGVVNAAPTVGTIAGGMVGSLAGGVGAVGGAGAGAAAGEAFKEKVTGQKVSGRNIVEQGGIGAVSEATGLGAAKAIGKAAELIPSAKRAAQLFADVKGAAGNAQVNLTRSAQHILEIQAEKDAGGGSSTVINKFLARTKNPTLQQFLKRGPNQPLTYTEARRFYSNLSKLTPEEVQTLKGPMKKAVVQLTQALKHDIGDAAAQYGQGAKYYAAMGEYAKAMKLAKVAEEMKSTLTKYAVRGAIGAIGAGAGAGAVYEIGKTMGFIPSVGR